VTKIGLGEELAMTARCPQMTGYGAKIGRKTEEAIVALLTTRTTEEAARAVSAPRRLR